MGEIQSESELTKIVVKQAQKTRCIAWHDIRQLNVVLAVVDSRLCRRVK